MQCYHTGSESFIRTFSLLVQIKFYFSNSKFIGIVYIISAKTDEDYSHYCITCTFLNEFNALLSSSKEAITFSKDLSDFDMVLSSV
jgi:hypothetical protein